MHSSTGFTPHFLTLDCDLRVPSDLLIGRPSERAVGVHALTLVNTLADAFQIARTTLLAIQRRSKDPYDTKIVERIFSPGHKDFIRIKNLFMKPGPKLLSSWSGPYEVIETKELLVNIRVKRVPNGREDWFTTIDYRILRCSPIERGPTFDSSMVDRNDPEYLPEEGDTVARP